jgi:hypothetical protein
LIASVAFFVKIVSFGVEPSQAAARSRPPSYRSVASTASGYTPRWMFALWRA